jgi:hypothetical protein
VAARDHHPFAEVVFWVGGVRCAQRHVFRSHITDSWGSSRPIHYRLGLQAGNVLTSAAQRDWNPTGGPSGPIDGRESTSGFPIFGGEITAVDGPSVNACDESGGNIVVTACQWWRDAVPGRPGTAGTAAR